MNFRTELKSCVKSNFYRHYGEENHDKNRFGPYKPKKSDALTSSTRWVKKIVGYKSSTLADMQIERMEPYMTKLQQLWVLLNTTGKRNLVQLIAYRLLGKHRVKLFTNNPSYHNALKAASALRKGDEEIDTKFFNFILNRFDLSSAGYPIELYFREPGVASDFLIEQYAYKEEGKTIVEAKAGDVVLDLGGCYGDTALYFAHKAGPTGKVYVFEFIPNNLIILRKNLALNPSLENRINIVEQPVSNSSDVHVYYRDNGPGSQVASEPFESQTGMATTITIDDFVERNGIEKVDFIKMDIEGSEPNALKGAEKTIRRCKPTLAIAIYHSMEDFVNIPEWIAALQLPYEYYLGHYTIHAEETVFFAKPKV